MSQSIDKKTVLAGFLNSELISKPDKKEVSVSVDDLLLYTKRLWNAGCGPIIWGEFNEQEMKHHLDSLAQRTVPLCQNYGGDHYYFSLDTFPPDQEALTFFKSTIAARQLTLFIKLSAQLNYPFLLMSFMGFDCFYEFPRRKKTQTE